MGSQYTIPNRSDGETYLVEDTVDGVINDLNHASFASELRWRAQVWQAEVANACSVDDRHDIGKVIGRLGVSCGSELPLSLGMRVLDEDRELVNLYLGVAAVDGDCRTTTRVGRLGVFVEASCWWPVKNEVCGCHTGCSGSQEQLEKHGLVLPNCTNSSDQWGLGARNGCRLVECVRRVWYANKSDRAVLGLIDYIQLAIELLHYTCQTRLGRLCLISAGIETCSKEYLASIYTPHAN